MLGFLRRDAAWLPAWLGLIPAAVYTASWTGWFATLYGWNRNGAYFNNGHPTSSTTTGPSSTTTPLPSSRS